MAEEEVSVKFGAQISELVSGINEAKEQISEFSERAAGGIESINQKFEALTVILAGGIFKSFIDEADGAIQQTYQISQRLGISAESASGLRVALGNVGVSTEEYLGIMQRMDRQLRTNEDSFNRMGVVTRDANGSLKNQQEIFQEALKVIGEYKVGVDRNEAAMTLFGGRVGDLTGLMRLNEEALKEGNEEAEKIGVKFGVDAVNGMYEFNKSMAKAEEVSLAFKVKLAQDLQPALEGLSNWFEEVGPQAAIDFGNAIKGTLTVITALYIGVQKIILIMEEMAEKASVMAARMANAVNPLSENNREAAVAAWDDLNQKYDKENEILAQKAKKMTYAIYGLDETGKPLPKPDVGLPGAGSEDFEDPKEQAKAEAEAEADAQKAYQIQLQMKKDYLQTSLQLEKLSIADEKSLDDIKVANGQMTKKQELDDLIKLTKQEQDASEEELNQEMAMYDKNTVAYQQAYDKKLIVTKQYNNEIDKLNAQSAAENAKQWTTLFNSIQSGMDTMVNGVLQGTQTWQQAMVKLFDNLALKFLDDVVLKGITDWAKKEAMNLAATQTAQDAMTAIGLQGALTQKATDAAVNSAKMTADGALVYGGVFANLAPLMGPAAAGPAAASEAQVLAMIPQASLDVGAWNLNSDMVAQLHAGEMVVPQTFAEGIRNGSGMIGGGGGGDQYMISMTINALDGANVANVLQTSAAQKIIVNSIQQQVRNLNPKLAGAPQ